MPCDAAKRLCDPGREHSRCAVWLTAVAVLLGMLAEPAYPDTKENCAAAWKAKSHTERGQTSHTAFSLRCRGKDYRVHAPAGAATRCEHGSQGHSGRARASCSSHGVAKAL